MTAIKKTKKRPISRRQAQREQQRNEQMLRDNSQKHWGRKLTDSDMEAVWEFNALAPKMSSDWHSGVSFDCIREKSKLDDELMILLQLSSEEKLDAYRKNIEKFNKNITADAPDWPRYPDEEFKLWLAEEAWAQVRRGEIDGRGIGPKYDTLRQLVEYWAQEYKAKDYKHEKIVSCIKAKLQNRSLKEEHERQFGPLPEDYYKTSRNTIVTYISKISKPRPYRRKGK